jgi:hypothetical protein
MAHRPAPPDPLAQPSAAPPVSAEVPAPARAADPDAVRALAYRLWEEAGCPEGRSDEFWHEAERRCARRAV